MAVSITVEGGQLKVDKGIDPVYYPLGDLRIKADDSENLIILLEDGKVVDSWLLTDITIPVAATLELMADAIAGLLDNASGSTTITGNVTVVQSTSANLNATVIGTVTANIGTIADIATNTTLTSVKTAVELIDNAIAGSEMQVDIVASLPSGTNLIGSVIEKRGTTTATSTVAASASSVQLLASNASRIKAVFFNDSASSAYVKEGTTASATDFTYKVLAFDTLIIDDYTGRIDAIWVSATGNARLSETT